MIRCGRENLNNITIDKLNACFIAKNIEIIAKLKESKVGDMTEFSPFLFKRIKGDNFTHTFLIWYPDSEGELKVLGYLNFGLAALDNLNNDWIANKELAWIWLENSTLYSGVAFEQIPSLAEALGFDFHRCSRIELSRDSTRNIYSCIRAAFADKGLTVIVNGKAVTDRKKVLTNMHVIHSLTLDRIKDPELHLHQEKKYTGLQLKAYNKGSEIAHSSRKDYILEFYGCPKSLHRLEVTLSTDFFREVPIRDLAMLQNQEFLNKLFFDALPRLLRFTRGRTPVEWSEILTTYPKRKKGTKKCSDRD